MKSIKIYDLECLVNYFSYTDIDEDGKTVNQFEISEVNNHVDAMCKYLDTQVKGMVGFNNLAYDYPLLEFIMTNRSVWKIYDVSNEKILEQIYAKSQEIIKNIKKGSANAPMIPQMDLFKIWHYDNKNKRQSLKGLEYHMKMDNVQDMPIKHDQWTKPIDHQMILDYNLNDVKATYKFWQISAEKIQLRMDLTKKYGIDFINASDSKIGADLALVLYCMRAQKEIEKVREKRTFHKQVHFKDIIFPYIKFSTPKFQKLLNENKTISIDAKETQELELKDKYKKEVLYGGIKFGYGMGGIHGSVKYKIFKSDDERVIVDADVASLYPNIAIANGLYPRHLGPVFVDVYRDDIVLPRLAAKAAGDKVVAEGLKIAANSIYGNSNSMYSFLYDPVYTLKTTINGQLMLTMLAEALQENLPGLELIQVNTDGITVRIDRKQEATYNEICAQWMKATKLELEFVDYEEMIIKDVNNYIAIKKGCDRSTRVKGDPLSYDKVKYKGDAFEIVKDYHKNSSFQIIPYALSEYFIKDTPFEETILNCTDPFMFFGRQRFRSNSQGILLSVNEHGEMVEEPQQKTMRYYISKNGSALVKEFTEKGSQQAMEKGFRITTANKVISYDIRDYDIDYHYYLTECQSVEAEFFPKQISLF